jgi:hypothetical protein
MDRGLGACGRRRYTYIDQHRAPCRFP